MDDFDDDFEDTRRFRKARKLKQRDEEITEFWLLSPKQLKSLNTQFVRHGLVHVPPSAGFGDRERVRVVSEHGSVELTVKVDSALRRDCVLIPAGTPDVNRLTPPILSEEGDGACYQEVRVRVEKM